MIAHAYQVRVYFQDTDAGGVMYHAGYLGFAERARTESLRDAGLPHCDMLSEHGVMFMVRSLQIEYFRPARLDDMLTIRTKTLATTAATVSLSQDFFRGEATLVEARVQLVCVKAANGSPARIPPRWRAALAADQTGNYQPGPYQPPPSRPTYEVKAKPKQVEEDVPSSPNPSSILKHSLSRSVVT